ncbi:YkvI family membrane protein [Youngiibacter fragilis]|uniref:Transporter n=1 Tax=Youngiibacter fragilis 232.1 TaxID=994573 RepID=V7I2M6_9CLOT|nr:hypothetical protein [Youngiibacter fragilis]ETA80098.1 hypothetical protein T472_0213390 [Youngiibacter fragilis 232.1]
MAEKTAKKSNFKLATSMGIGATWFGVHMGPGTASGRQGSTYYSTYGNWGLVTPLLAMGILGFIIYIVVEYCRQNGLTKYKDFFNHFFSPYEKIFSVLFDILFFFTYFMVVGASLATGGKILSNQIGLPYLVCAAIIGIIALMLIIYGEALIRNANSVMTWLMLAIIVSLLFFSLGSPQSQFSTEWTAKTWDSGTLFPALKAAVIYASFQVTGAIGSVASVTSGLNSKAESKAAAIFGFLTNSLLIVMIIVMQYGYPQLTKAEMPNYEILKLLNIPVLYWMYVALVELAVVSTVIGLNNGVVTRIQKYVKITNPMVKNVVLNVIFMMGATAVSLLGLTKIVGPGFTMLGYMCLPLVIIPILVIGYKKVIRNNRELPDNAAKAHLGLED